MHQLSDSELRHHLVGLPMTMVRRRRGPAVRSVLGRFGVPAHLRPLRLGVSAEKRGAT